MPKAENGYDLERYAPVARRITLFYERYPGGRIITTLVERDARAVIFRARVYRGCRRRASRGHRVGARARRRRRRERRRVPREHRDLRHRPRPREPRLHRERRAPEPGGDGARGAGAAGAAARLRSPTAQRGASSAFSPLLQSHADALGDVLALLALARQAGCVPRAPRTPARGCSRTRPRARSSRASRAGCARGCNATGSRARRPCNRPASSK